MFEFSVNKDMENQNNNHKRELQHIFYHIF